MCVCNVDGCASAMLMMAAVKMATVQFPFFLNIPVTLYVLHTRTHTLKKRDAKENRRKVTVSIQTGSTDHTPHTQTHTHLFI